MTRIQPQRGGQHHGKEHRQHLSCIRRQQVDNCLADVVKDSAPLLHGHHTRGEIVVGQHQVRSLFRDICAGDAHRNSDVGSFQRRGVIDAIPGHRDSLPVFLQRADNSQLMPWCHTSENGNGTDSNLQCLVRHSLQFRPRNNCRTRSSDTCLQRDGQCGRGMIAGNQHGPDSGGPGAFNSRSRLRPGGIQHADQAQENQVTFQLLRLRRTGCSRGTLAAPEGHTERAQRTGGQSFILREDGGATSLSEFERLLACQFVGAECQQGSGRAFGEDILLVRRTFCLVQRTHELALRRERCLSHPWIPDPERGLIEASPGPRHQQRAFSRIALNRPRPLLRGQMRIVGKDTRLQQPFRLMPPGLAKGLPAFRLQSTFGRIASPCKLRCPGRGYDDAHRHFVFRERACFVRSDDRHRTQRFHGRKLANNGTATGHLANSKRENQGDYGRQAFGCRRHCQRYPEHQHLNGSCQIPHPVEQQKRRHHDSCNYNHTQPQLLPDSGQIQLQRGRLGFGVAQQPGDTAQFRLHPGGCYQGPGMAKYNGRSGEHRIDPFCKGRALRQRLRDFGHRQAFACQRCLHGLQLHHVHKAGIG